MYRVQIWLIHYLECLLETNLAHILNNCYRYCCKYKAQEALHYLISGHTGTGLKKTSVKRIYNKEKFLCYLAQDDFPMMIHSHFVRIVVRMWNNICNVAFPCSFTSLSDFKSSLMNMYKSVLMSVFEVCPKSTSRSMSPHLVVRLMFSMFKFLYLLQILSFPWMGPSRGSECSVSAFLSWHLFFILFFNILIYKFSQS